MTPKKSLNAAELAEQVSLALEMEDLYFPKSVNSVFGQEILLTDEFGNWVKTLEIVHIGYTTWKIQWKYRFHKHDYIEWIIRSWIIDQIQSVAMLRMCQLAAKAIRDLPTINKAVTEFEKIIYKETMNWPQRLESDLSSEIIRAFRSIYNWCLNEDLPGFTEFRAADLESICLDHHKRGIHVLMRDFSEGPFTRVELGRIEAAINLTNKASPRQKAMFLLGRDWGPRPIQLALLRVDDFGEDELGPYVLIPSVKGTKRSKARRSPGNLVKRYISEDTTDAIKSQIKIAHHEVAHVRQRASILAQQIGAPPPDLPTPLFPCLAKSDEKILRLLRSKRLQQYILHADSHTISHNIRRLTQQLAIRSTRLTPDIEPDRFIKITAYRLRRTKGTSLVLSGATPEQVAEALDHQDISTIKHYFNYNLELHDFINAAHSSNPEINEAVLMWSGRLSEDLGPASGEFRVSNLGRCTRGSACPYHPTLSCYSCSSFRPLRSADHNGALSSLIELKDSLGGNSTGPIAQQLESAIYGAKSIILAIEESKQ
jgi:integrase